MLARFSFDARAFGQAVVLKDVIAATQEVPGVVTMRFYAFYRVDTPPAGPPDPDDRLDENRSLPAAPPRPQADGTILPAELLLIDSKQPFDALEVLP